MRSSRVVSLTRNDRVLFICFVDPDGLRLIRFQLADGGVQVLVPAADLDFVLAVDVADGGFFFGS